MGVWPLLGGAACSKFGPISFFKFLFVLMAKRSGNRRKLIKMLLRCYDLEYSRVLLFNGVGLFSFFHFFSCEVRNSLFESSETRIIEIQILHAADSLLYYKHALRVIFSGWKAVEEWRWPSTQSSPEVKKNRVIHLRHIWAFRACSMVKFTFLAIKY